MGLINKKKIGFFEYIMDSGSVHDLPDLRVPVPVPVRYNSFGTNTIFSCNIKIFNNDIIVTFSSDLTFIKNLVLQIQFIKKKFLGNN